MQARSGLVFITIGAILAYYTVRCKYETDAFLVGLMWPQLIAGSVTVLASRFIDGDGNGGEGGVARALGMP